MFDITQYAAIADREKFVVIFPDGIDGPGSFAPWNVGSGVCGLGWFVMGGGDDQAFVDALISFAEQDQCIDSRHIFMTGFSMGGYFSHETGCVSSKIAAIGPHSAGTHDLTGCPAKPKPAILFHFTSDSLIDYACGSSARDALIERNGCNAAGPDVVPVKGGTCEYYKGCSGGQVAMCSFEPPAWSDDGLPSGHGWSGGSKVGAESFGAITNTESASELGWASSGSTLGKIPAHRSTSRGWYAGMLDEAQPLRRGRVEPIVILFCRQRQSRAGKYHPGPVGRTMARARPPNLPRDGVAQ